MLDLTNIVKNINSILWGPPMMIILLGFGIFSTIYLGFPQLKRLPIGFKSTFGGIFNKKKTKKGSMSSFQALATAVAAQVGTGNIGGVAAAISMGGPGAVFWMWMTAIFGMSTISVEAILAQKYRRRRNGDLVGGPAYYLSQGLKNKGFENLGKFLATSFAVLIVVALGFVGNMVQSNSISLALAEAFNMPAIIIGFVISIFAAFIFIGGMGRIAKFAETVVPFMAVIYLLGSIVVMVRFSNMIGPTFKAIFEGAFSSKALLGGATGIAVKTAIRYGIARGLFSNEAGMGSTPNSHAVAHVDHPVIQGCVAMIGVFVDTMLVCTATSVVVIATKTYQIDSLQSVMITMEAFKIAFGKVGSSFLAISLTFFAFTTLVGWYYFGESNIKFLFKKKVCLRIYQFLVLLFIILGSVLKIELVWEMADMFNGLMVIPNIIGLFILLKEVKKIYRDFDIRNNNGEILSYNYLYED